MTQEKKIKCITILGMLWFGLYIRGLFSAGNMGAVQLTVHHKSQLQDQWSQKCLDTKVAAISTELFCTT